METMTIQTNCRSELIDVTDRISRLVNAAGISDGFVIAYVPHTTAGITINENADPDVAHDLLGTLDRLAPRGLGSYRHAEGNSDAHVKAALMGSSVTVFIEKSRLCLGTWQGIYFCEFDGPRSRRLMVKIFP